jgi:hypothetical protein
MGAVYAFLIIVMLLGPERMNHDLIMKDRQEEAEHLHEKEREAEMEHRDRTH